MHYDTMTQAGFYTIPFAFPYIYVLYFFLFFFITYYFNCLCFCWTQDLNHLETSVTAALDSPDSFGVFTLTIPSGVILQAISVPATPNLARCFPSYHRTMYLVQTVPATATLVRSFSFHSVISYNNGRTDWGVEFLPSSD